MGSEGDGRAGDDGLALDGERCFRTIFDEGPLGIAMVGLDLRILRANEAFARMLGYEAAELAGRSIAELSHPDDLPVDLANAQRVLQGEIGSYAMEKRYLARTGETVWAHLTATLVRGARGEPLYGLGIVEDITERKRLEQQLALAQKLEAIGRVAAGIAHDFNNLLTVVGGYAELALERSAGAGGDARVRRELEEIRRAAERGTALARQLLAVGRRQVVRARPVVLNDVVERLRPLLERLVGEDVRLRIRLEPSLGTTMADPSQIDQVLMNLVANARDAMPLGGTIEIETASLDLDERFCLAHPGARPGPYVLLAVSDTGVGMDEETLARIFEPFFTTKDYSKGTGLGLSTVYGIVKQAGGYIHVLTEPAGGTSFRVYLPRKDGAEPPPKRAEARRGVADAEGPATILVVEDDAAVLDMIVEALRDRGHRVLAARNGAEAVARAREHQGAIDVLVTDVVVPDGPGPALARRLRELYPDLRCLYVTGYAGEPVDDDDEPELLAKPFGTAALAERVARLLRGPLPARGGRRADAAARGDD